MGFLRFLALVCAAALWLSAPAQAQSNDDDVGFITRLLQDNLSEAGREVRIRGFQGALSSRATIDEMTIADDEGVWLILRDAAMTWSRSALLARRIEIAELSARELIVLRPPQTEESALPAPEARDEPASPFALPELPVSVRLDQLRLDRIELGEAILGSEVALSAEGALSLADGAGQTRLHLTRIDGTEGRFDLNAAFSNVTRQLALDLDLSEGPDGIAVNLLGIPDQPAAAMRISGEGPLDDFAAQISVATDGQERISGDVALRGDGVDTAQMLSVDIAGDLRPLLVEDFHPFFGAESRLRAAAQRATDGRLQLEELAVQTSLLDLRGRAALDADGVPELIDLTGQVAAADGAPVVLPIGGARTTVARADLAVGFDADVNEDWTLDFDLRDLQREDIAIDRLLLSGIGRIAQGPDGALDVVDAVVDYAAEGIAPADPALAKAIGAQVTGSTGIIWRRGEPLFIPGLLLEGADYWLQGEAEFEDGTLSLDVAAELGRLARFSGLADRPLSGALAGRVSGAVTPLTGGFDLQASLDGRNVSVGIEEVDRLLSGDSEIRLDARRGSDGITLRRAAARAQSLVAELSGVIRSDSLAVEGDLEFADLSVLGAQYAGTLDARVDVVTENGTDRLRMTATGRDLAFGQAELDRALHGRTALELVAAHSDGVVDIETLRLDNAALEAQVTGRVDPGASDIAASFTLPALSVLRPEFGGAVEGSANLREDGERRHLVLTVAGQDLAIGQAEADRALRGRTDLTLSGVQEGSTFDIETLRLANAALEASVTGRFDPGASDIAAEFRLPSLAAIRPGGGGALEGSATLREEGETRRVSLDATGRDLRAGVEQADALLRGTTLLTARVTERAGAVLVDSAELSNPQLSATVSGEAAGDTRAMQIDARLNNLALVVPGIAGAVQISGSVRETAGDYTIDLSGSGPAGIALRASGTVGADLRANLSVSGSGDLALINPRVEPSSVQGPMRFDIRVDGPLGLESVSGTATAEGVSFVQPAANLRLTEIAARADLRGGRADIQLSGRGARGGSFTAGGFAELTGAQRVDLQLSLNELAIADPQLFQTTVSGTFGFAGVLTGERRATGALTLGPTEIRVPGTGLGATGFVPDGLRHVNESAASRQTRDRAGIRTGETHGREPRPILIDLTLDAPNRVFIRGRGLDAELGGSLRLTGTTRDAIPIGEFSLIRGRLDLLGNRFTLTEGFASMQGDFTPFVRLVATTSSGGVSTSIVIEGAANAPEIRFESVPELPEEEVVSRLIFNRDLTSLSAFQAAQLASAIATLTGRGGTGFMERLRSSVGLDDLDITTDEDGNAAVRAGRYLTENIYTDLVIDPQGRSQVSINLDVSPSLTVRGRVDQQGRTGVGVFFERDY